MGGRGQDRSRPELSAEPRRHWAERVAQDFLEAQGWRTLATNYRLRGGEIDLVMEAPAAGPGDGVVVFVEVKQRASRTHGDAAEAIGSRKLAAIRLAAGHYLAYRLGDAEARSRIDAVLVDGSESRFVVRHLPEIA